MLIISFWLRDLEYIKEEERTAKEGEVHKYINNTLKPTTHKWLKEVGSNVMKQAVKDADRAKKRWFGGVSGKPKFKSRHKSKISFYVNYESLKRTRLGFKGKKLVRLGSLNKRLKREQRKLSRKLEGNTESYTKDRNPIYKRPLKVMKNIKKQNKKIRDLYKKLKDVRVNHLHQATSSIVKTKPRRIVMETLNVKGMMKNKHLSRTIAEQCLYEFKRQIVYKIGKYGIEFAEADRWYPSSKKCSNCGEIKKELEIVR